MAYAARVFGGGADLGEDCWVDDSSCEPCGRFNIQLINQEGGEELAGQLVLVINNK
jgi:hypothetical protein